MVRCARGAAGAAMSPWLPILVALVAALAVAALLWARRAGWPGDRPAARGDADGGGFSPDVLGFATVADDTIVLPDGERCAVLAVGSIAFDLLSELEARAAVAAWAAFLNALGHPVQLLVWVTPANVEGYAARLAGQARRAAGPLLASVSHEYAAYARYLARANALLERRFYLAVPSWDDEGDGGDDPATTLPRVNARATELAQALDRCRLPTRRLAAPDLVALLREGWRGEEAGEPGVAEAWRGDRLVARGAERIAPTPDPALPAALAVVRPAGPAATPPSAGVGRGAPRATVTTRQLGRR